MQRLWLIRHGRTDINEQGLWQGQSQDTPLNSIGRDQALRLASKIKGYIVSHGLNPIFDTVMVSPLKRTLETHEILRKYIRSIREAKCVIDNRVQEFNLGLWEGKTTKQIQTAYPQEYQLWQNPPPGFQIPGGDVIDDIRKKLKSTTDSLESTVQNDACIISHGGPGAFILQHYLGHTYFRDLRLENCGIAILEFDNGRARLLQLDNLV